MSPFFSQHRGRGWRSWIPITRERNLHGRRWFFLGLVFVFSVGCARKESAIARDRFNYCPTGMERAVYLSEMSWIPLLGRDVVGFPAATKLAPFLLSAGLRPEDLRGFLALLVEGRTGFCFGVDDSGAAIARLKSGELHVAVLGGREIVMLSAGPSGPDDGLWFWTALDKKTLAFGQRRVVTQMIEIAEERSGGFYDEQKELRHLLESATDAEIALYSFPSSPTPKKQDVTHPRTIPSVTAGLLGPVAVKPPMTNASVWGCRRSEKSAVLFAFWETRSRTIAHIAADFGSYLSQFQNVHVLNGQAFADRLACDQEGTLVRAYGFVDRSLVDRAFSAVQTLDKYTP